MNPREGAGQAEKERRGVFTVPSRVRRHSAPVRRAAVFWLWKRRAQPSRCAKTALKALRQPTRN